ncbi:MULTISPECIES: hypothetical protein [Streptomyces]|uniref:hypothetical protein n=1 Tax=Streptomyces TaxID=1883 RepID=UPI000A511DA1|nr:MULTISPECIES: hypothetical protein [Streptomyces]MDP9954238.1 hypothetical protein [Streptomyces sp. DSM 41269]MDP9954267.1 hypothetical protein [Streptomyces sp. DSM 41269]
MAYKRPPRTRTKLNNHREVLLLSTMAPEDYNVRPGETKSIACPDCRTWRRIMGDTDLKIREHCISDKVAEGEKHTLCPGSHQSIRVDIDVRRWQVKQDRLLREAMPQDNRRAAQQFHKPLPAPAAPVSRIKAEVTLETARQSYLAHRKGCARCVGGQHCTDGGILARRYVLALNQEPGCRAVQAKQERQTRRTERKQSAPAVRKEQWAGVLYQVRQADQRRRTMPEGAAPAEVPEVPLDRLVPRQVADRPDGGPLTCERCGAAESSLADALDAGWCRITRRPHCGRCAGRFPAWTRTPF